MALTLDDYKRIVHELDKCRIDYEECVVQAACYRDTLIYVDKANDIVQLVSKIQEASDGLCG